MLSFAALKIGEIPGYLVPHPIPLTLRFSSPQRVMGPTLPSGSWEHSLSFEVSMHSRGTLWIKLHVIYEASSPFLSLYLAPLNLQLAGFVRGEGVDVAQAHMAQRHEGAWLWVSRSQLHFQLVPEKSPVFRCCFGI